MGMERMVRMLLAAFLMTAVPLFAHADEARDLLRVDASWNELRLAGDARKLDALLADDWLLTHSDGRVQTKGEYLRELSSRRRSNQAITNEDVKTRMYGETAVVTGISVQSGVTDGKPWNGRFRFTRVWVAHAGGWRMVASHSSRVASEG